MRVRLQKSSISFGKSSKLTPRFVGPFEVLEIINPVAYQLSLSLVLAYIHNVFHVSLLKAYHLDISHVLD